MPQSTVHFYFRKALLMSLMNMLRENTLDKRMNLTFSPSYELNFRFCLKNNCSLKKILMQNSFAKKNILTINIYNWW